jgi:lipopolysaccharide export system ATP-binding protein
MAARPSKRRPPPPTPRPMPIAVPPAPSPATAPPPARAAAPAAPVPPAPAPQVHADARQPHLVADNTGLVGSNLGKSFRRRPVLRNVSVSLERGEAVGLLGPNGAGKTTCFYIITGLIKPDFGTVTLDGEDITDLPMYRRARLGIGYLPQEASIFRGLTVEQNLRAVLEVAEKEPEVREATIDSLLAEFSISHLRRAPSLALSGGERRRVEIARALATRPHFVLLDEPLAAIDPIAVADIRDLVAHLKDRGIGVMLTDHNVREALQIVDRAYILHEGSLLMEGEPDEIVNDADVRRVYLGERFRR